MCHFLQKRQFISLFLGGGIILTSVGFADEVENILSEQNSEAAPKSIRKQQAVFQALNKISGRSSRIVATIDEQISFEDLEITIKTCQERPPEFIPESATFVKVKEVSTQNTAFSGWMFASAPSLSPFEHPLFDLYLIGCKNSYEKINIESNEVDLTAIAPAPPRPLDLGVYTSSENTENAQTSSNEASSEATLDIDSLLN